MSPRRGAHDAAAGADGQSATELSVRLMEMPEATSVRYPDHLMPFVGSQAERDEQFANAVEAFLLSYGYNTARAYRADLEDIYLWARERGLDFFQLTEAAVRQYQGRLRRRKYSESTVRRRGTSWRMFSAQAVPGVKK